MDDPAHAGAGADGGDGDDGVNELDVFREVERGGFEQFLPVGRHVWEERGEIAEGGFRLGDGQRHLFGPCVMAQLRRADKGDGWKLARVSRGACISGKAYPERELQARTCRLMNLRGMADELGALPGD